MNDPLIRQCDISFQDIYKANIVKLLRFICLLSFNFKNIVMYILSTYQFELNMHKTINGLFNFRNILFLDLFVYDKVQQSNWQASERWATQIN